MDDLLNMAAGAEAPSSLSQVKELREPTVTERLIMKRQSLADRLQQTDEAIAALKDNPEIEKVLNLVQRAARL